MELLFGTIASPNVKTNLSKVSGNPLQTGFSDIVHRKDISKLVQVHTGGALHVHGHVAAAGVSHIVQLEEVGCLVQGLHFVQGHTEGSRVDVAQDLPKHACIQTLQNTIT